MSIVAPCTSCVELLGSDDDVWLQIPLICGTGCPQPTTANSVVSCGHMYLDQGEQLAVGSNRDNYLSFFAETSTGVSCFCLSLCVRVCVCVRAGKSLSAA